MYANKEGMQVRPEADPDIQQIAESGSQLEQNNLQQKAQANQEDILLRATKLEQEGSQGASDKFSSQEFDKMVEDIQDPVLKEQVCSLRKSLLSGFNKKFEEIAHVKKELENKINSIPARTEWTPEKVRSLASDPNFIEAAKRVGITGESPSTEDYSYEDQDPAMQKALKTIDELNRKISAIEQRTNQSTQMQIEMARNNQHKLLQSKYANYNPEEIDTITAEMLENKIQVTPEHVYWAFKGKENAEKMYKLGLKDAREGVADKIINSSFAEGSVPASANTNIEPQEKESYRSYSDRVIKNVLGLMRNDSK